MKLVLILFLLLNSCQFFPFVQKLGNSYAHNLKQKIQTRSAYDSFNNVYTIKTLWLNQKSLHASFKNRLKSVNSSVTTNTTQLLLNQDSVLFFVSLYTANFNYKDLRNQKVWNIFLTVDGKKYKAKSLASPFIQEQAHFLFPFHNHFSKGFFINFDIHPSKIKPSSQLTFYSFLGNSTITNFIKK